MKKIYAVICLCLSTIMLTSCSNKIIKSKSLDTPEYVFTYAENQPENYPTTQGAYRFAELVSEKTKGRILINVHYDAELGSESEVLKQMQYGGIDFARISLSQISEPFPQFNVLQMPYLYRDADHMWSVLEGDIGDEFMNSLEGSDLVALSWYDAGARNFYNYVKPITCLEDMNGLKIRVQESGLMLDMASALGAIPRSMPYSEVYSGLQTGIIDGAENNWPSYESMSHYEVARYFTVDEHTRVPELQLCAQSTWEKLSDEYKSIIKECAVMSAEYERELWTESEKTSKEKVQENGCEITVLSPEEKERFRIAVQPLYEKYCADYMDVIKKISDK